MEQYIRRRVDVGIVFDGGSPMGADGLQGGRGYNSTLREADGAVAGLGWR